MTVVSTTQDREALTFTIVAELAAPPSRVWQVWSDPRQLERWWGPPAYPATVTEHDLAPGGTVDYVMVGPEADRHRGWWRVRAVDPPHTLEFENGFADADGSPTTKTTTCAASSTDGCIVGGRITGTPPTASTARA